MDLIRDEFAKLEISKKKGFAKGRFSFNNKGGRCETCQGAGYVQVGMQFLGNVEVICEDCNGKRFNSETLEIKLFEKSIYEILELSIDEAAELFIAYNKISRYLHVLQKLGLGYIKLGQRSTTLSGGEAQRIKLAAELVKPERKNGLYIFDEPTTGLHTKDVEVLISNLDQLKQKENTVIIIEHNFDVILASDHNIDLGPKSGVDGGKIVFQGQINEGIKNNNSETYSSLKKEIQKEYNYVESKELAKNQNFSDQLQLLDLSLQQIQSFLFL